VLLAESRRALQFLRCSATPLSKSLRKEENFMRIHSRRA
jgi:hypothetical protein